MTHFPYQRLDTSRNEIRLLYPKHPSIDALSPSGLQETPSTQPNLRISRNEAVVTPDLSMQFELRTVSLDCKPEYTALSYVWGNPTGLGSITVNGTLFPVTRNLESALQHFAFKDILPAIWIDAVCIAQYNDDEKNEQVPKMGIIYSNARNVLVWLGPGTEDTDQAVLILAERRLQVIARYDLEIKRVLHNHEKEHLFWSVAESDQCVLLDLLKKSMETARADVFVSSHTFQDQQEFSDRASSSILSRDWWHRVWILQEFILASSCTFHIGCRSLGEIEINLLTAIRSCIEYRPKTRRGEVTQRTESQDTIQLSRGLRLPPLYLKTQVKDQDQNLLFNLLEKLYCGHQSKSIRCGDARDRIFALSGLAGKDCKRIGIQTDYRKQTEEVFIDVAQRLIASNKIDMLSLCSLRDPKDPYGSPRHAFKRPKLPSWAPDWSEDMPPPHAWYGSIRNILFSAARNTIFEASFNVYHDLSVSGTSFSMIVTGLLVDDILEVGRTGYRTGTGSLDAATPLTIQFKEIESMCRSLQKRGCNIYTVSQLREAIWRLPIWDHEGREDLRYQRAASLSKARSSAYIHNLLAEEASKKSASIENEITQPRVLPWLWREFRMRWYFAVFLFHWIKLMMSTEPWVSRSMQWIPDLAALLLLPFVGLVTIDEKRRARAILQAAHYSTDAVYGNPTRSIITKRGYMGYGPSSTRPGDIVCIFLGSHVPHVLRKRGDGQPGYVLVGDAFVYGAMDGELMKGDQDYVDFEIF